MIRSLKIALIVYGVILIFSGLAFIIAPYQVASMSGFGEIASYVPYFMATLGGCFIAVSVWFIVAGLDPLRHINLVQLAILWTSPGVVMGLYSIIRGAVDFSQAGMGIILDAVFVIAFLTLYPYPSPRFRSSPN